LVRERSFTSSHDDLLQLVLQLRAERVTGTMTIDFSQGGINRVRFREEQDIRYSEK
jgi:argininosuccinate synthase